VGDFLWSPILSNLDLIRTQIRHRLPVLARYHSINLNELGSDFHHIYIARTLCVSWFGYGFLL
jgi:hypothetical protein